MQLKKIYTAIVLVIAILLLLGANMYDMPHKVKSIAVGLIAALLCLMRDYETIATKWRANRKRQLALFLCQLTGVLLFTYAFWVYGDYLIGLLSPESAVGIIALIMVGVFVYWVRKNRKYEE
jgi:drug/metabolite transporter (DMT)-like permease